MKTFQQFQGDISKLPGLGGGGGGTDSIMSTSNAKSFKKRVGDVAKVLTFPFHKRRKDPTEKFATEGVASLALKGSSKLIPALMTGIGAAGTIMQIKNPKRSVYTGTRKSQKKERIPTKGNEKTNEVAKDLGLDLTDPRQRRKAQSRAIARGLKKKNKTNKKINKETDDVVKPRYDTKLKGIRVDAKKGEVKKSQELIDKLNNPNYFDKIMRNIRKEEAMAAPTNSVGGGQIAGTVEAGDNPPVKKKRPPIMARGKLPGARTRFKAGADFLANIKKNK